MNKYQLYEAGNMQPDTDPFSMPLTPRIELQTGKQLYMNISDLDAVVEMKDDGDVIQITSKSKLVNEDQQSPSSGEVNCEVNYIFTKEKVILKFKRDKIIEDGQIKTILPIISRSDEQMKIVTDKIIEIKKKGCRLRISSNQTIQQLPTTGGRIFNYVPGFEAIPLSFAHPDTTIQIEVVKNNFEL